jgi:hypothetical protein
MSTPDPQASQHGEALRTADALSSVRQHPEWFFPGHQFNVPDLVGLLVSESLNEGVEDLVIERLDNWVVLSSARDWLDGDLTSFLRLLPYGSASHSARAEVVVTAFCRATVTGSRGDRFEVLMQPGVDVPQLVSERVLDESKARVLAFLPPSNSDAGRGSALEGLEEDRSGRFQLVQGGAVDRVAAGVRSLSEKLQNLR